MKQNTRLAFFVTLIAGLAGIFARPLWILAKLSLHRNEYSHILLIPLISLFLIYWRRRELIAASASICPAGSLPLMLGLALYGVGKHFDLRSLTEVEPLFSLCIVGFVVACAGAAVLIYGWAAFRALLFPITFLLFLVPVPSVLLAKIVYCLQQGSSDAAALILTAMGIPFFRHEFIFQLPGITIEVARECSGIRSSTALFITTLLAVQFLLRSNWRRLALCVLIFPIAIVKNGLRIATLSALSVYVSRDFLFGWLHRSGGFLFFLIGLAILLTALRGLQLGDRAGESGNDNVGSLESARAQS